MRCSRGGSRVMGKIQADRRRAKARDAGRETPSGQLGAVIAGSKMTFPDHHERCFAALSSFLGLSVLGLFFSVSSLIFP